MQPRDLTHKLHGEALPEEDEVVESGMPTTPQKDSDPFSRALARAKLTRGARTITFGSSHSTAHDLD